jgi:predicted nucleic acid-binding protein
MVGIGNLFPFEVTRLSAHPSADLWQTTRRVAFGLGSAKGADRNGSTPDPEDSARDHPGRCSQARYTGSSENAEKPAIIFVALHRKQVRTKGPPLLPQDPLPPAPEAVIDTNVLLDWLVFADPGVSALTAAVRSGSLRWVATAPMLAELRHVLGRPPLNTRRPADLEDAIARCCCLVPEPPATHRRLICTDPDDQKFIDLALHRGSRWLISRDRALLKLRRRALAQFVQVCPPAAWRADIEPPAAGLPQR